MSDDLDALLQRLKKAELAIHALALGSSTELEYWRLRGKSEGVRLAISYLHELGRG